ncbi:MAG: hypothetical protein MUO51_02190 [Woeseiaceae bacterium]|jgi:hypothetical protein|nr:hypothetical protein [Woeseiaceae bacterium]TFG40680.1 MAG: hypothetical protein E4H42_03765 [Chromatiales bacterium]
MSSDEKDPEMICALTADEHVALQRGLRSLPLTMPPRKVWLRIKEQAEAEGLFTQPAPRTHKRWYAGVGLAAAALMAAVMMPGGHKAIDPRDVVPQGETSNPNDLSNLRALQVQSRELERDLRSLPDEPRVARAGTVATMSDIEGRIAAIDYQLSDSTVEWADGDKEIFWRERVRLMKLLLQLRYAQAQRAAY